MTNWVRGPDLRSFLDEVRSGRPEVAQPAGGRQALPRPGAWLCARCIAIAAIVHGDIKPENLILAREPNRLVMIDFGAAWMAERTTRRDPGDGSSRYYPAPEQLDDPQRSDVDALLVDARSDQFSATVVAYEMLTGVRPYGEMAGEAGLQENRATYEPLYRPPSQLSPMRHQIPPRIWRLVDEVIGRGLKLDAADRFPSRSRG